MGDVYMENIFMGREYEVERKDCELLLRDKSDNQIKVDIIFNLDPKVNNKALESVKYFWSNILI
jgi:hypothetical protein